MEIKLNEKKTFTIKWKTAEFVFKNDTRTFFNLLAGNFNHDSIIESCKKDLLEVKGLTTGQRDVTASDFDNLPVDIFLHVTNAYAEKVKDFLNNLESTAKKKKIAKK